jgi:hypothetical protein
MTTSLSTFVTQVSILLGPNDLTELTDNEIRTLVKAAVERYSKDEPADVTEDEAGDGGKYYAVTGLASWIEGYSHVVSIEYPALAVSADTNPQHLDPEDWQDSYWVGSARYLFFPNHAPATGENFRVTYTAPYVWTADVTNTPTNHFYAICNLAAGLACQAIATKYSRTNDSIISADSVGHTSRAMEFARRAREYIGLYEEQLGLGDGSGDGPGFVQAAGAFVDLDTAPGWTIGRQYLFHGRGTR